MAVEVGDKRITSQLNLQHMEGTNDDNQEIQGLEPEVQGLKEALSTVISLFQKQFPNKNVEVPNTVTRIVNRDECDTTVANLLLVWSHTMI